MICCQLSSFSRRKCIELRNIGCPITLYLARSLPEICARPYGGGESPLHPPLLPSLKGRVVRCHRIRPSRRL
ncbi:MAG: hypothetical protein GPOALKHO_001126 [Sodalis sp.]|nr:MAG: hypothetical protein GPOALKHO_001126 [Sodalis sp.]